MSSAMQQRKAEILAKRAKLAELKRQRELRQKEFSQTRANTGDASEVQRPFPLTYGRPCRLKRASAYVYLSF